MKKGWVIFIAVIALIAGVVFTLIAVIPEGKSIEVNLVNAIGDQLPYYEFRVQGKEIPSGQTVKVFSDFEIEVFKVEKDKKTLIDGLNIGSLLEKGDKVSYAYYGEISTRGEALCIYIKHTDDSFREVSIKIN